jgi:hypothetical protein
VDRILRGKSEVSAFRKQTYQIIYAKLSPDGGTLRSPRNLHLENAMRSSFKSVCLLICCTFFAASASAQVQSLDPNYTVSLLASGLVLPVGGMIYRPSTNDFLVAQEDSAQIVSVNASTGKIGAFATVPSSACRSGHCVFDVAINSSGDVFATGFTFEGPIVHFDSSGNLIETFPCPSGCQQALAFDSKNDLYIPGSALGSGSTAGSTIYEYAAGSTTSPTVFASGFSSLEGIRFNSADQLFVDDGPTGNVYQVTPGGTTSGDHILWASGLDFPDGIAIDPTTGSIFIGSLDGTVTRATSPGVFSTFATGISGAEAIGFDTAGNLYVGDRFVGAVWKFTRSVATSAPTITPNHGGNTGTVTVRITGQALENGATVMLTGSGSDIVGTNTALLNPGILGTTFNVTNATPGTRDVVVSNPDGTSEALRGAFTVEQGGAPQLVVQLIGLDKIRFNQPQTYYLQVSNTGFVDSQPQIISLEIPSSVQFQQFEGSGLFTAGSTSSPDFAIPSGVTPNDQELLFATAGVPAGSIQLAPIQLTLQSSAATLVSGLPATSAIALTSPSSFNARAASQESIADLSIDQFLGLENIPLIPFLSSYPQCTSQFYSELNAYDTVLSSYQAVQGAQLDTISAIASLPVELGKTTAAALAVIAAAPFLEAALPATAAGAVANSFAGLELGNLVTNGLSCAQSRILTSDFQSCVEALEPDWTTKANGGIAALQSVVSAQTAGLPANSAAVIDAKALTSELSVLQASVQLALNGISSAGDIIEAYGSEHAARGLLDQSLGPYNLARSAYQSCINNSQLPPPPVNPPGTTLPIGGVGSLDPNAIAGPMGSGQQNYVIGTNPFTYGVFYSNEVSATAPAQNVVVTNQLDVTHDNLLSFSLGPITVGNQVISPPPYSSTFLTTLDLRPSTDLLLAIKASLDPSTGLVTWTFTSIDPTTNQPPTDPTVGFLPPGGQGSAFFTVIPQNGLATNVQIVDQANVVFDSNPTISTPTWLNTIDATAPKSQVLQQPSAVYSPNILVSWAGTDVGSGIQNYSIYVSDNGGIFAPWLLNSAATAATYTGQLGHTYSFYSIATDNVGNLEASKTTPDTTTTIVQDTTPPVISPTITGAFGNSGWYTGIVTVSWSVTDPESGVSSASGCTGTTLTTNTKGVTITCSATNSAGLSSSDSVTIKIDQTPPVISGLPQPGCSLWPPDYRLIHVATVSAKDALSGLAAFSVTATSNEPSDPNDKDDIEIKGKGLEPREVYLRAIELHHHDHDRDHDKRHHEPEEPKIYTITANASDLAGNPTTSTATCTVENPRKR